jgi:hypothetical protein
VGATVTSTTVAPVAVESATVQRTAATGSAGELAITGGSSGTGGEIALCLVAVGVGCVAVARRRTRHSGARP